MKADQIAARPNLIFSRVRQQWVVQTPQELVRQAFLDVVLTEYGFDLDQIAEEEELTGRRGTGHARADFVIWRTVQDKKDQKPPLIIVECRSDNVTIKAADYAQGDNYARITDAPFFVTHNTRETRFWRVRKDRVPGYTEEIETIPHADASDREIEDIPNSLNTFKEDEFADLLHECHNVIRNREKKDIADQMAERERPLPSELEDIDPESRVYLRALCSAREVKVDEVSKATRGVLEPSDLISAGLMIKGRAGRSRAYEVKQPAERLPDLLQRFGSGEAPPQVDLFGEVAPPRPRHTPLFIDHVHLLMGLVDAGESIIPWLDRLRAQTPQLRAALEYLEARNRGFAVSCRKVLEVIDIGPLFRGKGA